MSTATWSRKKVLTAIGLVGLIAVLTGQTYALIVVGQGRTVGTSGGTSVPDQKTITVQGAGQVGISPDRAIVTIGVVTQASTAGTAVQENANTMGQVISGLNGIGIDNSNIQTTYYYVSSQTSCCTGPPSITGYQVTDEIQVTVAVSGQSLSQLGASVGQVIDTSTSKGANQVYGIQFTASSIELQNAQQAALKEAAQKASQQAHLIASAMNVTITGVVSVTSNPGYSPSVYFAGASLSASTPIVAPQSLTVTATVQAVFSIG